jgi:hypothetical protein
MNNAADNINTQLTNQIGNKTLKELDYDLKKGELEQGWLGKIWGGTSNSKINIAALVILILLLFACVYSWFASDAFPAKDCWTTVGPFIALALGYIFGENKSDKKEH